VVSVEHIPDENGGEEASTENGNDLPPE